MRSKLRGASIRGSEEALNCDGNTMPLVAFAPGRKPMRARHEVSPGAAVAANATDRSLTERAAAVRMTLRTVHGSSLRRSRHLGPKAGYTPETSGDFTLTLN